MIRPITPSDLPRLREMLQALADHEGGTAVASLEALEAAAFGPRPLIRALIAEHGMVIYFPEFSTHRGLPGVFVQDLYVAPQARGQGLARALLKATLAHQDWGARFIALTVSHDNDLARAFYAKAGFASRGSEALIHMEPESL
ncbi:GNAT family N-acetyltransferase [Stagnihabitans tardus]|uniref:GNAT family N-acetyltransferase n=1 Tax=Stagnihabitans tardus TaxID=2699202 RepID=A0AAE4YCE3_9RHOB|nr:GNAT family N-acetyltransferase [Stagnihabitans tardus]NBZ88628.1 GNAT family N-acetyltransferase [Stagnihabitans tardus]